MTNVDKTSVCLSADELRNLRNGYLMRFGPTHDSSHPDDLAIRAKLDRAIARLEERDGSTSE